MAGSINYKERLLHNHAENLAISEDLIEITINLKLHQNKAMIIFQPFVLAELAVVIRRQVIFIHYADEDSGAMHNQAYPFSDHPEIE